MKRKEKYLEYDYTSAYTDRIDQMERAFLESMLPGGVIRNGTYATKEISSGDQLEIEIYPQFTRKQKEQIPAAGMKKRSRESQHDLNDKNSRKECERRINANFTNSDIWGTFTYRDSELPASWEEAQKNMRDFLRRLNYRRKKHGLGPAKYIYVTELSPKGRYHHHFVTGGDMPMDEIEALWTKGDRNELRKLDRDENGLSGMAHYITKEAPQTKAGKGKKRWTASKGLKKPEIKVTHYKITSRDVARMAVDFEALTEKCKKLFGPKGYTWTDGRTYFNAVNGFVYLTARMRGEKIEQGNSDGKTDKRSGDTMERRKRGSDLYRTVRAGDRPPREERRRAGG